MTRTAIQRLLALAGIGVTAAFANAQIVLNEVWPNPPNGGDNAGFEYIEIYGPPNFDLTGFAVLMVNHENNTREFDEGFTLDGFSTDENGLFVVHGGRDALKFFPTMVPNPSFNPIFVISPTNMPFLNGVPFSVAHIPALDTPGKLNNDGSATFILVRRRPNHALNTNGTSAYLTGYSWGKDYQVDQDDDSALDYGDEPANNVRQVEPAQFIDEISWSNGGGNEYNRQGRGIRKNKISETPGFNPDSAVRVRYYNDNPLAGWTVTDGEPERTTNGDESWFYGESTNVNPGTSTYGLFKDFYEGEDRTFGGPTDPNGPLFTFTGTQQNPLEYPFFENTNAYDPAHGDKLFKPYAITGLRVTPGGFNDAEGPSLNTQPVGTQFRWSEFYGDFNFDGIVDCEDRLMIRQAAYEGWNLDETADAFTTQGNPTIRYTRELENFNGVLMMIRMDLNDGSTGEWTSGQVMQGSRIVAWGGSVTPSDLAAFDAAFPALAGTTCLPCNTDLNNNGNSDIFDLTIFLERLETPTLAEDINGDAVIDNNDTKAFITNIQNGCN